MLNDSNLSTSLVIRADADARIGTGHIMRCIALGQAWQDAGGQVIFMTGCQIEPLVQRLHNENFQVLLLEEDADFLPQLGKGKSESGTPWVVMDGYHFDLSSQRAVRKAGHKLLLVDDYNHLPAYECDILLNQNLGSEDLAYVLNPQASKCLGTDYAMLRREFRSGAWSERAFPDLGKNVLVTLGGADPDNCTLDVIHALEQTAIDGLHVKVVVGPANQYIDQLEKAVEDSELEIDILFTIKDMTPLMRWADFAVSAGGSTCWEFCCLGLPFLTIIIAENQRGLAKELDRRGVARCLGEHPLRGNVAHELKRLVSDAELRRYRSGKVRDLVDGFGVDRALYRATRDAGLDLFSDRLSFRKVREDDSEQLWKWANDPTVRSQCYSSDPIPWESHQAWFAEKWVADHVLMLILELDRCAVGQIRYDCNEGIAHIGFSIDWNFRGLGLGRRIVKDSLKIAFESLEVDAIQAEVFVDNEASNNVFNRCGFKCMKKTEIHGILSNIYMKEQE